MKTRKVGESYSKLVIFPLYLAVMLFVIFWLKSKFKQCLYLELS